MQIQIVSHRTLMADEQKYDQTVNHFAQIYYVYVNHCMMSNIHLFLLSLSVTLNYLLSYPC